VETKNSQHFEASPRNSQNKEPSLLAFCCSSNLRIAGEFIGQEQATLELVDDLVEHSLPSTVATPTIKCTQE